MTVRLNEYMSSRKHLLTGVIAALVVIALAACGSDEEGGPAPDYDAALKGAPPKLAALHDQSSELLPGGKAAFDARLRELRGYPVVVNKWASWCGPCRAEFPIFQSVAADQGKEVAFLGIDSNDGEDSARDFVAEFPLPYPSYIDPDQEIADQLEGALAFPATAFYDSEGRLVHVRNGPYSNDDELTADIERYAR
jgi:cytochrome c biogenesis protein CcmG, thiol:disulfide interchange protein DsbE